VSVSTNYLWPHPFQGSLATRPYIGYKAIAHVAPQSNPVRSATDVVPYASYWGRITAREVAQALNLQIEAAKEALEDAVADGRLIRADRVYLAPATLPSS